MNRYISLSFGVESTTLALLYGKGATALWADTGSEPAEIYQRVASVVKYLYKVHGGDFRFKILRGFKKHKGVRYNSLRDYEIACGFLPNHRARYCTGAFKIEPIDRFLSKQGDCELMIGFNADETPGKDRAGNYELCANVRYLYPLHADGVDRDMCEEILRIHGLHPDFPAYMKRGGCKECYYKSKAEYKAMYFLAPAEFQEVRQLEETIQDKRQKYFSILTNVTMQQIEDECNRELQMFGLGELISQYSKVIKPLSCGAFCRR